MLRRLHLFLLASATTWAATIAPVGSGGYFATDSTVTYQSVGAGGTLLAGTSVDDAVSTFSLPFSLIFYGTTYSAGSTISASTNGNLQFTSSGASDDFVNIPVGSTAGSVPALTAPAAFVYWDDLILTTPGGGVYVATLGVVGSRQLVVEWRGRRIGDGATGQNINFQAVFFENSTDFVFHYGQTGVGTTSNGASATVGSRRDLSNYTEWSFNNAVITPNLHIRFSLTNPNPATDVPEPSSLAMFLLAGGGALALRLRR